MQTGGLHGQHNVPGRNPLGAEDLVPFHDTRSGTGEVVLLRLQQSRMFSGFPAKQGTSSLGAGHSNALHDSRNAFRIDLATGDLVGHEQRFSTADDEIVDHHADQVETDGVVAVQRLRNSNLCAYPVGRGG